MVDPTGEIGINVAGAIVGTISGGVGGYITSGSWTGTWQGAVAGGVAANLVGQAVGNTDACQPVMNLNYELAILSGGGGGGAGGYRLAAYLSNAKRSASSFILTQRVGSSAALNKFGGAVAEESISGITELGLNSLRNDTPRKDCSCPAK